MLTLVVPDPDESFLIPMNISWYLFPLAAAVSFVWTASRYEDSTLIVKRSLKLFGQIIFFMTIILCVLVALSHNL